MATEEAQKRRRDEESYAIETSNYTDVFTAIEFALNDCKSIVGGDRNPDQYDLWH